MTTADTDEDDLKTTDQETAPGEPLAGDQDQTQGDDAEARSNEDAESADEVDDGHDEVQDPLLLAQMDKPDKPKEAQPPKADATKGKKPEPTKADDPKAEKPKDKADDNSNPVDDHQAADADLKAAQERIPIEDWQKVSHKTRSQILTMQRIARTSHAAVAKANADAELASKSYREVDAFRQEHDLNPREFMLAVSLGGALKAGRKEAIEFLETNLNALKKHHGVAPAAPEVKTETYGIDPDELEKLVKGAEEFDLDAISKLKELAGKAKVAKAAKAVPPPAAQPKADDRQQQPSQAADNAEQAEFAAIHDALSALGVGEDQMEGHVLSLIKDITGGNSQKMPRTGERLRALVKAHTVRVQASSKTPAKTQPNLPSAPMSGRKGPVRQAVTTDPNQPADPLKHALKRG